MAEILKCKVKQRDRVSVSLDREVMVSDSYPRLTEKPKINGIELDGNKSLEELSILSRKHVEYNRCDLKSFEKDSFLLVLSGDGIAEKVGLADITEGRIKTLDKMPANLQIGNYVFLLKGEKYNGSNSK